MGVRVAALHPGGDERGGRTATGDLQPGALPLRPDATGLLRHRRPGEGHGHQRGVGVSQLPVPDHGLLRTGLLRRRRPRPRHRLHAGVERLALRGVVRAAPRPDRPPRDHLSRRPGGGGGRDPAQRRARLHLGHPPGAAARDRAAVAVGRGALGPDHGGDRRDRHRGVAARGELRNAEGSPRGTGAPAGGHLVRSAVPARRAPSGCGRATRCATRGSRSP